MCKCLYCYQDLEEGQIDFHPHCAKKIFGTKETPLLEYRHEDLDRLAEHSRGHGVASARGCRWRRIAARRSVEIYFVTVS